MRRRESADRKNFLHECTETDGGLSVCKLRDVSPFSRRKASHLTEFLIRKSTTCLLLLQYQSPFWDNGPWRNEKTWNKRIFWPFEKTSWNRELMVFIFWCDTQSFMDVKTIKKYYKRILSDRWLLQQAAKETLGIITSNCCLSDKSWKVNEFPLFFLLLLISLKVKFPFPADSLSQFNK